MAGRAGRLGFEAEGKSVVLADTPMERSRLYRKFVEGEPEPITSSFNEREPETWLVRLLAQVQKTTQDQAVELIANTFGGYLASLRQPGWAASIDGQLRELLAHMEADGLVEDDGDGHIRLSVLGFACGQSPLALRSAMQLIGLLRNLGPGELTPENLMVLVQALPEQDDRYTPMGKTNSESVRARDAAQRFGQHTSELLGQRAPAENGFYARCKRALILGDWTDGVAVEEIENRYTANPFSPVGHGDIRGLADSTRFYMASAVRIASILFDGVGPSEEEMDRQLKSLDLGLPGDVLWLADLGLGLDRGESLALHSASIRTLEELDNMDEEVLNALVGIGRANQIRALLKATAQAT